MIIIQLQYQQINNIKSNSTLHIDFQEEFLIKKECLKKKNFFKEINQH